MELFICMKRIWHLITYNGWYAIKPNQTGVRLDCGSMSLHCFFEILSLLCLRLLRLKDFSVGEISSDSPLVPKKLSGDTLEVSPLMVAVALELFFELATTGYSVLGVRVVDCPISSSALLALAFEVCAFWKSFGWGTASMLTFFLPSMVTGTT